MIMSQEIIKKIDNLQKSQDAKFREIDDKLDAIIEIKTTLYGAKGDKTGGLCGKVEKNTAEIGKVKTLYVTLASVLGGIMGYLGSLLKM